MDVWKYATDVRLYVALGIILAFCIGSLGEIVATLSIIVLIMQMIASIHGLHIDRKDFRKEMLPSVFSFICCFGICTGSALLVGLFFKDAHMGMWYGWVMLAAVPSAVSVITVSLMMKGNMSMALVSMVLIYALAFFITPAMTMSFIGDAVSPLEILKYIILFIAIPLIINIPASRISIQKKYKVCFINIMMLLLLTFSLGKNRDFIFDNTELIFWVIFACIIRTFVVGALLMYLLRRFDANRENTVVYTGHAVWKNSGLATSMCMLLMPGIPEAALPCVISLVIESVWFAITNKEVASHWPSEIYENNM